MFDTENQPVAAYGIACTEAIYSPVFETSVLNLSSVVPAGRCLSDDVMISADGNVILLETCLPGDSPTERLDLSLQSYTLNTASLNSFPDISLSIDGVILNPLEIIPFGFERILSTDGQYYFVKQWWTGNDGSGNQIRQVGAVLWNTASSNWLVRGQANDLRGCTPTAQVSCDSPYFHAMSKDGNRQYFSLPTIAYQRCESVTVAG